MDDTQRAPDAGARRRSRRPTPAERREQRAQVESLGEVLDAAARLLEARPRSEAEVRERLVRLGYRRELVGEAVERLLELGYLDDEAFARGWVESRDRSSPRGEHALRVELSRKGVDRALIDQVLEDRRAAAADGHAPGAVATASADEAAAERLLRKRMAGIQRERDPRRRLQRAYALLARGGFAPDVCAHVSRLVLAGAVDVGTDDDRLEP